MAINYAEKYSAKIDERFKIGAVSAPAINNDYDFVGVQTVKVYSVPTAAMNDYTRSGTSRYGTPAELENSVQELTLTRDRSFTFTIDRGNFDDTMMANSAGAGAPAAAGRGGNPGAGHLPSGSDLRQCGYNVNGPPTLPKKTHTVRFWMVRWR